MIESRKVSRLFAPEVHVWDREIFEHPARLAAAMVERWGIVAGEPDGEDSAGRSKLRLLTPQELVDRACEVASRLMQQFRDREWIHIAESMLPAAEPPPDTNTKERETDGDADADAE